MKSTLSIKLSGKWLALLLIIGIGFVFFLYLPVNYDFDGIVFSSYLRYALIKGNLVNIIQSHHPLYFPVTYIIYKGLHAVTGYTVMEYFHLQLFSLCCGLFALWISYKLIWASLLTYQWWQRFFAMWGLAFIAFSYGFWYYSVEAEVHMPGLLFILYGIYLLFFKTGSHGIDHVRSSWGAALCFAVAAGFHLIHGLIAISLLLIFLMERKPFLKIVRFFSIYALFFVGGLTVLSLRIHFNFIEHLTNQLAGKESLAGYSISYWSGGFSMQSLWASLKATAHGLLVLTTPLSTVLTMGLFLAMVVVILWSAIKEKNRTIYYRLGAWILPYLIFFSFWDHHNMEFKLNIIFPIILLFILSMAALSNRLEGKKRFLLPTAFGSLVIALLFFNYYSFLLPANDLAVNRHYQVAEAVRLKTPTNALIIVGGCGSQFSIYSKIYIPYFANRRIFILDWMLGHGLSMEDISASIKREQSQGNPVFLFSDILNPTSLTHRQLILNHHLDPTRFFESLKQLTSGTKKGLTQSVNEKRIALVDDYYLIDVGTPF